jgi:hypothetical protein
MSETSIAAGGSVDLSTSLSNVAKLAAHPKFVWVFNANCDGQSFIMTLYFLYVEFSDFYVN